MIGGGGGGGGEWRGWEEKDEKKVEGSLHSGD